jgi:hypothetical protein
MKNLIPIIFYGALIVLIFADSGPIRTICIVIGVIGAIVGLIYNGIGNRDYPDHDGDASS